MKIHLHPFDHTIPAMKLIPWGTICQHVVASIEITFRRNSRRPGYHQRNQPEQQQRRTARYETGAPFSCTTWRSSTQHRGKDQIQLVKKLESTIASERKTKTEIHAGYSPTPKKKRATKKPARSCTIPRRVATIPHAMVSVGSHSRGEVRLRMMLHGIFIHRRQSSSLSGTISLSLANSR